LLLGSGDFVDGDLKSLRDKHVTIDSVVFGEKTFNTADVLAVLLRDAAATADHHPLVRACDGSAYAPRALAIHQGQLILEEDADDEPAGKVTLPLSEVSEIIP
jgi:hypothetical protein